jgi:hypothetical protein
VIPSNDKSDYSEIGGLATQAMRRPRVSSMSRRSDHERGARR